MPSLHALLNLPSNPSARRGASTLAAGFEALRRQQEAAQAPNRHGDPRPMLRIGAADCQFLRRVNQEVRGLPSAEVHRTPCLPAVQAVIDRFRRQLPEVRSPETMLNRFTREGYPAGAKTWPSMADHRARDMLSAAAPGSRHLLVGPDQRVLFEGSRFVHLGKSITVIQPAPEQFAALCTAALAAGLAEVPRGPGTQPVRGFRQAGTELRICRAHAADMDVQHEVFDSVADLNAACIYETPQRALEVLRAFVGSLAPQGRLLVSVKSAGDRQETGLTLTQALSFAEDARLTARILGFAHLVDWQEGGSKVQHVLREDLDVAGPDIQQGLAGLDEESALATDGEMRGVARWMLELRRR